MSAPEDKKGYRLISPEGTEIAVSREMFDAVQFFTQTRRAGSAQLEFRNGNVAGAEVRFRVQPEKV